MTKATTTAHIDEQAIQLEKVIQHLTQMDSAVRNAIGIADTGYVAGSNYALDLRRMREDIQKRLGEFRRQLEALHA